MHNQNLYLLCAMIVCTGQNLSHVFHVTFSVRSLDLFQNKQKKSNKQLDWSMVSCETKPSKYSPDPALLSFWDQRRPRVFTGILWSTNTKILEASPTNFSTRSMSCWDMRVWQVSHISTRYYHSPLEIPCVLHFWWGFLVADISLGSWAMFVPFLLHRW